MKFIIISRRVKFELLARSQYIRWEIHYINCKDDIQVGEKQHHIAPMMRKIIHYQKKCDPDKRGFSIESSFL